MIQATPAEQRRLHDLQQVDTAIRRLLQRRASLPEQQALDENADLLTKTAGEYANAREQLERLRVQQRRHEEEIGQVDSRRKSEEGRMYSGLITSEKELEALRSEISSLKARKRDLEDSLLEIMEQVEELEALTAKLEARHADLSGKLGGLAEARDRAASEIDGELAERRQEREGIAGEIAAEVLAYYDDLRERKDGLAVAQLQGRGCSGCRLELTAIELEELRADARSGLARCAQCGRILVLA